jgi:hypothetical protein
MKKYSTTGFVLLLTAMLAAIWHFLTWRVVVVAGGFSAIWFSISMILLARPPGFPEFVSEESGSDEQYVVRRDVLPRLPLAERFQLSLGVACGTCLLIWITLVMLAR